jgi:hypothetical protein
MYGAKQNHRDVIKKGTPVFCRHCCYSSYVASSKSHPRTHNWKISIKNDELIKNKTFPLPSTKIPTTNVVPITTLGCGSAQIKIKIFCGLS